MGAAPAPGQTAGMDRRLSWESVEAMVAERRRYADPRDEPAVTVRFATRADGENLRRLAQIDSGPMPTGTTLIGEVDGELVAALPVGGGRALADPFRPTAGVMRLLRLRESQLRGRQRRGRRPSRRAPQIQTAGQPSIRISPDRR